MSLTLIGKKRGMTRLFHTKTGKVVPCTIIEVEPNVIMQIKTAESDGYSAVQLTSVSLTSGQKKNMSKPIAGRFEAVKIEPKKTIKESRVEDVSSYTIGQEIHVDHFPEGSFVDVRGKSKGRGYAGVIKRHGMKLIIQSHGVGPIMRHGGSIGCVRGHGRVRKNKQMSGHMGDAKTMVEGLEVIKVDTNLNALVVKGSIPGPNGNIVYVRKALKKQ